MTYKLQALLQLDTPKFGSRTEFATLQPRVIEAKWTRNNHLVADELTVTLGWQEAGVDPRMLKNSRCVFWMWDANWEDFDQDAHRRFAGICKTATLRDGDGTQAVDMTFHDYTTLFIENKPLATTGMPEWSDTLETVWQRICDNTGWMDPDSGDILSSVAPLRGNLVFERPDFASRPLGEMTNSRMHAISKPQPRSGASSWDVWQWCCAVLGLISFIDGDKCVVTDTAVHYSRPEAAIAIHGENIHNLELTSDSSIASKGILLKSFDPLQGLALEGYYPPPGDSRLKIRRAAVRPKSDGGLAVMANEQSPDYEEYNRYDITNQGALDRAAREAYEERSRQELQGAFHTSELRLVNSVNNPVEVLDLRAGDTIRVILEPQINRNVLMALGGEDARVRYLVDNCDYDEGVARLIAKNLDIESLANQFFHVKTLEVAIGPEHADIEIKFHNIIETNT